jgi:aryl-alcohol dehydrogenase-like predicted oxidoreductase
MTIPLPTRKLGKNGPEVTAVGFGAMGLYILTMYSATKGPNTA